jgi:uncharacterized protein YprB with RNaseH-like and TPR domain
MGKLDRIAKKLLGKTGEPGSETDSNSFSRLGPDNSDPFRMKESLVEKYRDSDLLEETEFSIIKNDYGKTLHRVERINKPVKTPSTQPDDILNDLKLIHGIGTTREKGLKEQGYTTVQDLVDHDRWGEKAESVSQVFRENNTTEAYGVLRKWKSLSDPDLVKLAGLVNKEDYAFVDIETMGLSNQPIFLLGISHPVAGGILVHQYLAGDLNQEMATLVQFSKKLDDLGIILTYNGKNFDIPYIERRLSYYGKGKKFSQPHLDLYLFTKKFLKDRVKNCQLNTIEESILGIERDLDVPSRLVPDFYKTYRDKGNPGPLLPILAHHRQDMLSLADLFQKITEVALDESA